MKEEWRAFAIELARKMMEHIDAFGDSEGELADADFKNILRWFAERLKSVAQSYPADAASGSGIRGPLVTMAENLSAETDMIDLKSKDTCIRMMSGVAYDLGHPQAPISRKAHRESKLWQQKDVMGDGVTYLRPMLEIALEAAEEARESKPGQS